MITELIPKSLTDRLCSQFEFSEICELRLRQDKPIFVGTLQGYSRLSGENCTKEIIDTVINKASNNSIYMVNTMLKRGYLPYKNGIRIGVCGEIVEEKGEVITIKNITSLVVRVAKNVQNCCLEYMDFLIEKSTNSVFSSLIFSPPGGGKTTFIRDISLQLCRRFPSQNILILDDKGELTAPSCEGQSLCLGESIDVLYASSKAYSFKLAIANLRPDVIICDEIVSNEDIESIKYALTMGVRIIATMHANSISDLQEKSCFFSVTGHGVFDRYVMLKCANVVGIFDRELSRVL